MAIGAGDRRQLLARAIRDLDTRATRQRHDLGERAAPAGEHGDLVGTAPVRAEQLEHRVPAVDAAFGHYRPSASSRGPAGVSSTSQPSRRDLVAHLVAAPEITARPRLAARGEQAAGPRPAGRPSSCATAEEPEHARELHQLVDAGDERAGVAGTPVARVGQRSAEIEEDAERLRGVEVVVHRLLEARAELRECRWQRRRDRRRRAPAAAS